MSTTNNPKVKLGYDDYVLFPDDRNRHEIIDGDHFKNPAPNTYHQTVSKRIQYVLYSEIELRDSGVVFSAPVDVQLGAHDIVQPDLVVVLSDSAARVTPSEILGAPDLLIEILSPSTAKSDCELKRRIYERSGVREYWIVDPDSHTVRQLVLKNEGFVEQSVSDDVEMAVLPQVKVAFSSVW